MHSILRTLLVFILLAAAGFAADFAEWRKKAETGDANAQFNLGVMYDNGKDVWKNYAKAVKWYRLAAEQGNAGAQFNLGVMYANGTGVPEDLVQAHVWWNIAGAKGRGDSKKMLAMIEPEMTSEQKAEAMKLARVLFAKLPKEQ